MASLEDELNALIAGAETANDEAKTAKKAAVKTRRKSRDLEEKLANLVIDNDLVQTAVSTMTTKLEVDATDEESIKTYFKKIDKDGNGTLEFDELKSALKDAMTITDDEVKALWDSIVDKDTPKIDESVFTKLVKATAKPKD